MLTLVIDHLLEFLILVLFLEQALFPEHYRCDPFARNLAFCVHNSVTPLSYLLVTICLALLAEPVPFVVLEIALLTPPIWPLEHTLAVYFVQVPLSLVYLVVLPFLHSVTAVHAVVSKIPFILTTIRPDHNPMSGLLPILEFAIVLSAIVPAFSAQAVLFVFLPKANLLLQLIVSGNLVHLLAVAMCFIFQPFSELLITLHVL